VSVTIQSTISDWDFARSVTTYATHPLHPYPAKMPPALARKLICSYSKENDLILDPFCGSGTVLVEAALNGRSSVGVDINPLAVLVSRCKTTPISDDRLSQGINAVLRLLNGDNRQYSSIVRFENVDYWFKKRVQQRLAKLRGIIMAIRQPDLKCFFQICLSATVREVSNIRRGEFKPWRLPAEELRAHHPDVYAIFSHIVLHRAKMVSEYRKMLPRDDLPTATVLGNAKNLPLRKGCADMVLTSPPYGDSTTTVAYGQFCKFSSLWIGLPEDSALRLDQKSLGGRLSCSSLEHGLSPTLSETLATLEELGSRRKVMVSRFFADIATSLSGVEKSLKSGGIMCVVVGNRTVSRTQVQTARILEELVQALGKFRHEDTFVRRIPTKTLPWANAPENIINYKGETISQESILVFSKK
jgi:site-specific DNA-methyltransferase (cytosine-N4-specific)